MMIQLSENERDWKLTRENGKAKGDNQQEEGLISAVNREREAKEEAIT